MNQPHLNPILISERLMLLSLVWRIDDTGEEVKYEISINIIIEKNIMNCLWFCQKYVIA